MNWPLSQDYNEAIQNPASCFGDADLKSGEVPCGPLGIPVPRSGNFADVYRVKGGDGSVWAVKCFTRKVTGLRERYALIDEHLRTLALPFTVSFTYFEEGIRVRGSWFPIVKMEWVEGFTLNEFVRDNLDKPQVLQALLTIWGRLAKRLRDAEVAHADLQHGNVLLVPGFSAAKLGLKLIDYDGMWIPALAGKNSGEVGHAAYQHPLRAASHIFGPDVDRFPHLVIAAGLRGAMLGGKALWEQFDNGDNLLFREADFVDPPNSPLLKKLAEFRDPTLNALIANIAVGAKKPLDKTPWLDQLIPEDKPAFLTPIQEREAAQALGFALQKKGTETTKSLGTATVKSIAREAWTEVKAPAAKAAASEFASLTTKPGEALKRKGSKVPMLAGLGVFVLLAGGAFVALGGLGGKRDKAQAKADTAAPAIEKKDAVEPKSNPETPGDKADPKKDEPAAVPVVAPKKGPAAANTVTYRFQPRGQVNAKAKVMHALSDGTLAVLSAAEPPTLEILDPAGVKDPVPVMLSPMRTYTDFRFSWDRSRLALADDKGIVLLVDPASGTIQREISETSQPVAGLGFMGDDKGVVFGNRQTDEAIIVNCESGQVFRHVPSTKTGMAKPEGIADVLTAAGSSTVMIRMKTSIHTWTPGHPSSWWLFNRYITGIAVSGDGGVRYQMTDRPGNPEAILLHLVTEQNPKEFKTNLDQPPADLHDCFLDFNGNLLGGLSDKTLLLYDGRTGKPAGSFALEEPLVRAELVEKNLIAVQMKSGAVSLLDIVPNAKSEGAVSAAVAGKFERIADFPAEASWGCLDFNFAGTELFYGSNFGDGIRSYNLLTRAGGANWPVGKVLSLRVGADAKVLAQTAPSVAKMWDAGGKNEELFAFTSEVAGVARAAGRFNVMGGAQDGKVYFIIPGKDGTGGSYKMHEPERRIRSFEMTPNGGLMFTVDDTFEIAYGFRPPRGGVNRIQDAGRNALKIFPSPNGAMVLGFGVGNDVQVWDTVTKLPKYKIEGHAAAVADAKFSPDGKYVLTAGKDRTLRLWNAADGTPVEKFDLPEPANGLVFSRDAKLAAVACGAGPTARIGVWTLPLPGPQVLTTLLQPSRINAGVPVPPKPIEVAKFGTGLGAVFTAATTADSVRAIGYSADSRKLAIAYRDGSAVVHEADTMKELGRIEISKEGCTAAAISGDTLFACGPDNKLKTWNVSTRKLVKEMDANKSNVLGIYPYAEGSMALVRDETGLTSYTIATGKVRSYPITTTFPAADNGKFVAVPNQRKALLMDGQFIVTFNPDDGSARTVHDYELIVKTFATTPNGTKIACATASNILVTNALGGLLCRIPLRPVGTGTETVHGLAFADNGRHLVAMSNRNGVRVWDVDKKGTVLATFKGDYTIYEASAVSPDGRWYALVAGSRKTDLGELKHALTIHRLADDKKK